MEEGLLHELEMNERRLKTLRDLADVRMLVFIVNPASGALLECQEPITDIATFVAIGAEPIRR